MPKSWEVGWLVPTNHHTQSPDGQRLSVVGRLCNPPTREVFGVLQLFTFSAEAGELIAGDTVHS